MDKRTETPETEALSRMQLDPDIQEETRSFASVGAGLSQARAADTAAPTSTAILPLNVSSGAHRPSRGTVALATRAGGLNKFREMTTKFYQKAFLDPQLDPFIRSHDDPHGERFASWIAEKMGLGKPWTEERQTRAVCPFAAKGHSFDTPHDRSSAHFAAWHSPKRSDSKWGQHFKLDDSRVWMRLHFWSAREVGLFESAPDFMDYYIRFIGHFVSVYERTAPPFARESARWSAIAANTERYLSNGRRMDDVIGLSLSAALAQLPEHERTYTGSNAYVKLWPYELG